MSDFHALKNLEEQILQQEKFAPINNAPHGKLVVVLKQHRF
jgi:hypothetical protein